MSLARQLLTAASNPPVKDPITGTLTCWFASLQTDMLVYRIEIQGPPTSIAEVHVGFNAGIGSYRSISYFGQKDDADYPAGLLVPAASMLLVVWYDISAGGIPNPVPITASTATAIAHAEIEIG